MKFTLKKTLKGIAGVTVGTLITVAGIVASTRDSGEYDNDDYGLSTQHSAGGACLFNGLACVVQSCRQVCNDDDDFSFGELLSNSGIMSIEDTEEDTEEEQEVEPFEFNLNS